MSTGQRAPSPAKPKIFYGYIIVASAFFIMIVLLGGNGFFGVFFKPVSEEFHWSRAVTSAAFSLSSLMGGVSGIFIGKLNDRFGPRLVITVCGILVGAGFMLMSVINQLWQLFFFYGVLIGLGMSGGYVPTLSSIARWFSSRLNLMSGIVLIGLSIGELAAAPVANSLIDRYGWRESYLILGGVILVISILAAQFMKRDPSIIGLKPYGERGQPKQDSGVTLREALVTRQFWTVIAMEFVFGYILMTILVHLVPHVTDLKISMSTAAAIMAVTGGASIPGRITLGLAGDRLGNRAIYTMGFILMAICMVWLIFIKDTLSLYFCAALFGFAYGGMESSESPITVWLFGIKNHGLIFGTLVLAFTIGAAIGPFVTGYIFDFSGSYQTAFIMMAVLSIMGLILTLTLKPLRKQ
jgi:MFS family permease